MPHFYDSAGNPMHEVPNKKSGGMRPTNVEDARKLKLFPSTTTVLSGQRKFGIDVYHKNNLLDAACYYRHEELTDDDFRHVVEERADRPARSDFGTRFHAAIENYLKTQAWPTDEDLALHFVAFKKWWADEGYEPVMVERSFCCPDLGFGGTTDLVMKRDRYYLVDWTTQKGQTLKDLHHYPEKAVQEASYINGLQRLGLITEGKVATMTVVISQVIPGVISLKAYAPEEVSRYWRSFLLQVAHWYGPDGQGAKLPWPKALNETLIEALR